MPITKVMRDIYLLKIVYIYIDLYMKEYMCRVEIQLTLDLCMSASDLN